MIHLQINNLICIFYPIRILAFWHILAILANLIMAFWQNYGILAELWHFGRIMAFWQNYGILAEFWHLGKKPKYFGKCKNNFG